jgi:hypothetical protein
MPDFETRKIEVRYYSTDYGPFQFDLEEALPSGTTISTVTVKSYLTKIDREDDVADYTETTSELIDAVKTVVSGNYGVNVYFNYPTTAAYVGGAKHTLLFEITLDNGAKHVYYHHYVRCFY